MESSKNGRKKQTSRQSFFLVVLTLPVLLLLTRCDNLKLETGGGDFSKKAVKQIAEGPSDERAEGVLIADYFDALHSDDTKRQSMRTHTQWSTELQFILTDAFLGDTATIRVRNKTKDQIIMEINATEDMDGGYRLEHGEAGGLFLTIWPGHEAMIDKFIPGANELLLLARDSKGARSIKISVVVEDFDLITPTSLSRSRDAAESDDNDAYITGSILTGAGSAAQVIKSKSVLNTGLIGLFYEVN